MQIRGCEKLTNANVMIVYNLPSKNAKVKTRFHDELYGRHKEGILFKIPHRKLARGVIEISQRNLGEIRPVFDKYSVVYELRLVNPIRDSDQIMKIVTNIKDPYERAIESDSLSFSKFITKKLEEIGGKTLERSELENEILAATDTVQKWVRKHEDEPLATGFAYIFKGLETAENKEPEIVKRNALRIAESLKNWTIGYHILKESKDKETVEEVLKKYKSKKE